MKALEFLIFGPDLQALSLRGTRFRRASEAQLHHN